MTTLTPLCAGLPVVRIRLPRLRSVPRGHFDPRVVEVLAPPLFALAPALAGDTEEHLEVTAERDREAATPFHGCGEKRTQRAGCDQRGVELALLDALAQVCEQAERGPEALLRLSAVAVRKLDRADVRRLEPRLARVAPDRLERLARRALAQELRERAHEQHAPSAEKRQPATRFVRRARAVGLVVEVVNRLAAKVVVAEELVVGRPV